MRVHAFEGFDWPNVACLQHQCNYYFNDSLFTVDQSSPQDGYYTDEYYYNGGFQMMNTGFGGRPMYLFGPFTYSNNKVSISFHIRLDDGWNTPKRPGDSEFFTICANEGNVTGWTKLLSLAIRDGRRTTGKAACPNAGAIQAWSRFADGDLRNFGNEDPASGVMIAETAAGAMEVGTWYHIEIVIEQDTDYPFKVYLDGDEILSGTAAMPETVWTSPIWAGPRWESYGFCAFTIDNLVILSGVDAPAGQWRVSTIRPAMDVTTNWSLYKINPALDSYHYTKLSEIWYNTQGSIYTGFTGVNDIFKFDRARPVGQIAAVKFVALCYPKIASGVANSQFKIISIKEGEALQELASLAAVIPNKGQWYDFAVPDVVLQTDSNGRAWVEGDFVGSWFFGLQFTSGSELAVRQLMLQRLHRGSQGATCYYIGY